MTDLSGRTALVTGGVRGIGAGIARAFASAGMRVAIAYLSNESAAMATLESLSGDGHVKVRADLADPEQVRRMVDEAATALGRLDVLVNNAGIYEIQSFETPDYETWLHAWQRTMDTNLMGAVNATYCALRHMRAQGGGKVICVGSRGGFRGEVESPAYAVSKLGMVAFTRSMARALAKENILAYCIAPGWTETDMSRERMAPRVQTILKDIPAGRIATPEDVAGVALFLASDAANYLTGITIDVNGASYLH